MPNRPVAESPELQELRRQAIERLKNRHGKIVDMPADRVEELVHELEVYQVELEVQNEDLRRAQQAAADALDRYRDLYYGAPVGYLTVDPDGKILQANRAASQLCSREQEDLEGQFLRHLLVPEDRDKLWQLLRSTATGSPQTGEFRLERSDLHQRWVHADMSLVSHREGAPSGSRVTLTDITGRVRAEEALRQSEQRLAQANRVAQLGIFEHDHLTDVFEFSPLMRELMGFGEQEAITLEAITERISPEDRQSFAVAVEKAHDPKGNGSFVIDYRLARSGGAVRWLSVRSQTFFEGVQDTRRPVRTVGAALDVTERKQFQAELERLVAERTARLQELVNELEHFSYTITHDMRAPLRAMIGYAELLKKQCATYEPPEPREFVGKIMAGAQRMDRLITDALSYSRLLQQELPLQAVDSEALLRGMLDTYPELQPSRAQVRIENPLPIVLGNPAFLTQCFSNLLGNAAKFAKPGQMPEIRVRAEDCGEWSRLWIEDKGIGIEPELLPRIFDMFSRGNAEREGTGIGLALVRKAAHRMGGKVGVESEVGNGSRFWLELRRAQNPATSVAGLDSGPGLTGNPEPQGWTVLYVEDEEGDAFFMQNAFESAGMASALRVVTDGQWALDYLSGTGSYVDRKAHPLPSLVLLDLNLPRVHGFQVLKWMRQQPAYADIPVVIFSSSTNEEDRVTAQALGATDYMVKPSSGLRFTDTVQRLQQRWLGKR